MDKPTSYPYDPATHEHRDADLIIDGASLIRCGACGHPMALGPMSDYARIVIAKRNRRGRWPAVTEEAVNTEEGLVSRICG